MPISERIRVDRLQTVRSQFVDGVLYCLILFGFPVLFFSLARISVTGWRSIMYFHVALLPLIIAAALLRRRLSYKLKASLLLGGLFAHNILAFMAWGLMGAGAPGLVLLALLTTLLFDTPAALFVTLLNVLCGGIVAVCVHLGIVTYGFDVGAYMLSPVSWLTSLYGGALFAGMALAGCRVVYRELVRLNRDLGERSADLQRINDKLATQMMERRRNEEKLRESEERWRSLYESLPGGSFVVNRDYVIEDVNDILCATVGYSRGELVGQLCDIICPKGPHKCPIFDLGKERIENDETAIKRKDGVLVPIVKSARRIEVAGREMIVENFQDITQLKRTQDEVARLRGLLGNIVNSMPSVIVGVDCEGRVTQWNRQAEMETGITAENAHGMVVGDACPRLAGEMGRVFDAIRTGETQGAMRVATETEGGIRYSDASVYPLIAGGKSEGAVIRVDDVTERVRMEEMMVQSEKMLSVGGLATGMAHEINNPLAGIIQNIQVMRNRIGGDSAKNKEVAEACGTSMEAIDAYMKERGVSASLESVMDSGRRAAHIVKNMLSFCRKGGAWSGANDLRSLLDRTVELASSDYDLKNRYGFAGIEIVREYEDDMPNTACAADEIQHVFLNVVRNAAQALAEKEGGDSPRLTLRVMREEGVARVEIEDNGPGMDEDTRKRIFEPFYTTKEVGTGTGLGLSVSYFIVVENHGGTISAESVPGKGSKFVIRLPLAPA